MQLDELGFNPLIRLRLNHVSESDDLKNLITAFIRVRLHLLIASAICEDRCHISGLWRNVCLSSAV